MKLSDCCGAAAYSNGDSSTEDFGICPDCKEHCEYIEGEIMEVCEECGSVIEECYCDMLNSDTTAQECVATESQSGNKSL